MRNIFIYRLFKYSPQACVVVLLFIASYAVVFYKKMDMVFFPYNSMFTIDFTKTSKSVTYAVKLNGQLVKITHQPYWKKDFLETSLYGYCKYISSGRTVFLDGYIKQKFGDEKIRDLLLKNLTAGKEAAMDWPSWYCKFAGYSVPSKSNIELMQYHFSFENNQATITDSISIYKTFLP
jgi:hypothetical protein